MFMIGSVFVGSSMAGSENELKLSNGSVSKHSGKLLVSGRIYNGWGCKKMKVTVYVEGNKGHKKAFQKTIKTGNCINCLFDMKKKTGFEDRIWKIYKSSVKCVD